MANFSITTVASTGRRLEGNEIGLVATPDAALIATFSYPVLVDNSVSTLPNTLVVNGTVLGSSTVLIQGQLDVARAVNVVDATSFFMTVGPQGLVQSVQQQALRADYSGTLTLNNAGTMMSSQYVAIEITPTDSSIQARISNSGLIDGPQGAIKVYTGSGTARILNSGTIQSASNTAITLNDISGSFGAGLLHNTGTVIGGLYSLDASAGNGVTVVYNAGLLDGHILLGGGQDEYEGGNGQHRGTVFGQGDSDVLAGGLYSDRFDGGSGNDTLVGRDGDDRLSGGPDDDFILGGQGNDEISGGDDNDTINANAGDDSVFGDAGADVMVGQDGSDFLDGGEGNDTMDGGNGDDILEGGSGNDILRGRAGEDDLAGGLGLDLLTGGQDADSFVFRSLAETLVGAMRDQILDFEQRLDLIVVAGLSPGVFEFKGTAAFAPSGNPELRLFETPTGSTIVQLDANGDGTQDAEIRVANVTGLTAEDFVL